MTDPAPDPGAFRLLFVCTGNICRSPLAEQLFRRDLGRRSDLVVASAGLRAMTGAPMDEYPAAISRRLGGEPRGAVGKQLHARFVDGADLVLVMTAAQLSQLTREYPKATRKAFTLRQFAELLALLQTPPDATGTLPERLRLLVAWVSQNRFRAGAEGLDVEDPFGRGELVHEDVAEMIHGAVSMIADRFSLEAAQAN